eukprot:jgi/Psemu1/183344/e_gw1.31.39.1
MPGKTKTLSLETESFRDAITSYIDSHKPDPIARRQLESWKLTWSDGGDSNSNSNSNSTSNENQNDNDNQNDWTPDRVLAGTLEICGEYVAVSLAIECCWAANRDAKTNKRTSRASTNDEDGRLSFVCRVASCRWITEDEASSSSSGGGDDDNKAERKIRKKMVARLRKDSYISKLHDEHDDDDDDDDGLCLARASIYVNASTFEMEERVDVTETVAETLRRALWSSAPSSLDVVEVVLALPSLPCATTTTTTTTTTKSSTSGKKTTRLANRARLRMLEDAMLDECEKEGDERILEDLNISKKTKR